MKLLIVGSGMYVSGRGTDEIGTILPAAIEFSKHVTNPNYQITVACTSLESMEQLWIRSDIIREDLHVKDDALVDCKLMDEINYSDYDACIVAIPDKNHFEVISSALKAHLDILCVKPLVTTHEECWGIEALLTDSPKDIITAVEFHKRFDKSNLTIRENINLIGDLLNVNVEYSQPKTIPLKHFKKWSGTSNPFQYLGPHYIDIISYITHAKPTGVKAVGQKKYCKSKGIDTYDSVQAMIEWDKGFNSMWDISWVDDLNSPSFSNQKIRFHGTKGKIEADQSNRGITIHSDDQKYTQPNPYFSKKYGSSFRGYGCDSIIHFLSLVEGSETSQLLPTFAESMTNVKTIEAVNNSLETNEYVPVDHKIYGDLN